MLALQVLHYGRHLDAYQRRAGSHNSSIAVYANDSDVVIGLASLQEQLTGSTMQTVYRTSLYTEHDM
jgi:hypothetical protein